MKTRNKHIAISTLTLAMVLIIACGDDGGVNNGSTVPNDTSAVAGSSSAKETSSSGEDGGGGTGTSANSSSVSGMSSNSHTGTSSGSLEGSSANQSSSSVVRYSSGCVDGETEVIFGVTFLCMDGELVAQLAPRSSSSPYYDVDNVFAKWEDNRAVYSEFTDPRDGQTYKTVVVRVSTVGDISEYREYFAQNLNYGTQVMLKEGQAQTAGTKYCYDDDPLHCKHHLGGLYTWSNAMGLPAACDTVAVGSENCPKDGML